MTATLPIALVILQIPFLALMFFSHYNDRHFLDDGCHVYSWVWGRFFKADNDLEIRPSHSAPASVSDTESGSF